MSTATAPDKTCILRFDNRDDDTVTDDNDVPSILDEHTSVVLDRIRYTVNVTPSTSTVTATTNYRLAQRRASGKVFAFWSIHWSLSITTTASGLILCRERGRAGVPHSRYLFSAKDLSTAVRLLVNPDDDQKATAHLRQLRRVIAREVATHCGEFPDIDERFPMLAQMAQDMGEDTTTHTLFEESPPPVRIALCDAQSWAEATRNLFGTSRYRKSLTRAITELLAPCTQHTAGTAEFDRRIWALDHLWAYRGLVPIDWIIDTINDMRGHFTAETADTYMFGYPFHMDSFERRKIRSILRQVPAPVLRRLLAQTCCDPNPVARTWSHMARSGRNVTLLSEAIAARRQRNIRDIKDLEQLVLKLPERTRSSRDSRAAATGKVLRDERYFEQARATLNGYLPEAESVSRDQWVANTPHYIAELNRFEDAERARQIEEQRRQLKIAATKTQTWLDRVTPQLDGVRLTGGYTVSVADNPETLSRWAVAMSNCISLYDNALDTDLLGALVDEAGTPVANFHIVYDVDTDQGLLDEIAGRFNNNVRKTIDQPVIDAFLALCTKNSITLSRMGEHTLAA
ncbi:hypothetical protein ACT3SZ_14915 [Corynebacterium sp. AOP40-9SA-29]|uniref:hypothetical protein n=1 Tax=Corynebacterium sp. AOP40-9SA-29 TaxID=3457677 RepID=UPI0040337A11